MTEHKRKFTVRQAADRIGVSVGTLRRWIRKGAVEVVLVGPFRAIRITEEECDRHVIHPNQPQSGG